MTYQYKTEPYKHQHDIFMESRDRRYVGLFMEMGTGKTKVCIDTMAYLFHEGRMRNVLIVAPKGVYRNWINVEIPKHLPDYVPLYIVTWAASMPASEREKLSDMWMSRHDSKLRVLLMNVEALSTERGGHMAITFCKHTHGGTMVIVDESTCIKSSSAKRTKMITLAAKDVEFKRINSGLPNPNSPVDMFSQLKFLDPYCMPTQSFYAFRNRYCVMREVRLGMRRFNKIIGFQRMDELHSIMERVGHRVLKRDCLDLPEKIYQTRDIELSPDQRIAYDALVKDTMITLNRDENRQFLTAPLMITRLIRLHQIVCGYLVLDSGELVNLQNSRIEALKEVLDEMEPPVLIWATYRNDIRRITNVISEVYGPEKVAHFFGDTSDKDRQKTLEGFYDGKVQYFVGNPATGGYGLSLTRAHNVVYYSNSYNLEHRLQSEDRVHRIGQDRAVTYVDLVTRNTVDEKILNALRNKETLAKTLLDQGAEFFRQG